MNVLLLTSHSIAEYDDLRMLSDLGYDVFSIGAYTNPAQPTDTKRPALPDAPYFPELEALCDEVREQHAGEDPGPRIDWAKSNLHPDLVEWADAIIVHHFPESWIGLAWDAIGHKRVIWRTCGQSNPALEDYMAQFRREGLEIIRYSPAERRYFEEIGHFAGEDAVIRFGKYPGDYDTWIGSAKRVVNVTQGLLQRGEHTQYSFWEEATRGLERLPIGPGSEVIGGTGEVGYDEMLALLQLSRCYLYTGTQPASYTLGLMEAMFAGIPTVSIGPARMWAPELFEGDEIARIWSNDPGMARLRLREMFADWDYARAVGASQRTRAIELFGIDRIGAAWEAFLG